MKNRELSSNQLSPHISSTHHQMDWYRGHSLGSGSSATVSLANSAAGGAFAVKWVELSRSEQLQREERILSSLRSPFVVGYMGHDIRRDNNKLLFNLFMEYIPAGTLADEIRRCGGRLRESAIGCYARHIAQGLDYIHSRGLVHCDIKSQNILIGETGAKISDFGCAKWSNGDDDRKALIAGTPLFMAPEVARGEDQGSPSDVWALGCTIIEMATGGAPWPNAANAVAALYRIGFSDELPWVPNFLSDQAKDFLGKCLRRDPKERWTANQLLKHPFVGELSPPQGKQVPESNSNSNSPTSILDQNFWSSLEESETPGYLKQASVWYSPAERIRRLRTFSTAEKWTWDDSWVTIRGSSHEGSNVLEVEEERHGDEAETEHFLDNNFSCRLFVRDGGVESNSNFQIDKEHLLITSTSISNFLVSS